MKGVNIYEVGGKKLAMWIDHREIVALTVNKNLLHIEIRFKSNPMPLFVGCSDEDELYKIAHAIRELRQ